MPLQQTKSFEDSTNALKKNNNKISRPGVLTEEEYKEQIKKEQRKKMLNDGLGE